MPLSDIIWSREHLLRIISDVLAKFASHYTQRNVLCAFGTKRKRRPNASFGNKDGMQSERDSRWTLRQSIYDLFISFFRLPEEDVGSSKHFESRPDFISIARCVLECATFGVCWWSHIVYDWILCANGCTNAVNWNVSARTYSETKINV